MTDWRDNAACKNKDLKLFFSDDADSIFLAKRICADCPVRRACYDHAMATQEVDGIYGGLTPAERGSKTQNWSRCIACDTEFIRNSRTKFCSMECRQDRRFEQMREREKHREPRSHHARTA